MFSGFSFSIYQYFIHFYSWIINKSVDGDTTFCLSIYPLRNVWVVLSFWLLWIKVPWTFTQVFVWTHSLASLEYVPRRVMAGLRGEFLLNLLRNSKRLSKVAVSFYALISIVPVSPHPGQHFSWSLSSFCTTLLHLSRLFFSVMKGKDSK